MADDIKRRQDLHNRSPNCQRRPLIAKMIDRSIGLADQRVPSVVSDTAALHCVVEHEVELCKGCFGSRWGQLLLFYLRRHVILRLRLINLLRAIKIPASSTAGHGFHFVDAGIRSSLGAGR